MKLIDAIRGKDLKAIVEGATGFRYRPKKGELEHGPNCSFRLEDTTAWSYSWWCFFRVIDGYAVFNQHRYSPTTGKHQAWMRELLRKLGIWPAIFVNTRKSLSDMSIADVRAAVISELNGVLAELAGCKRASKRRDRLEHRRDNLAWYVEQIDGRAFEPNQIMIVERDSADWGAPDVGVHRLDPDERELADALETAERDGFDTVYVYRTHKSKARKLALVAEAARA